MQRYTIEDFHRDYPDENACLERLRSRRFPDGSTCEKCERVTKYHRDAERKSYSCQWCGHHVHPTAGTIFHKSVTPLRLWFHAVFLVAQTRCGISAKQLERELGVTYKTAWRMFNKIRSMLQDDGDEPLSGTVEMDETYVGGKRRGTPKGRPGKDSHKTPVFGMAERKGHVVAKVVPNASQAAIFPYVKKKGHAEVDGLHGRVRGLHAATAHGLRAQEGSPQGRNLRRGRRSHEHRRGLLVAHKARHKRRIPLGFFQAFAKLFGRIRIQVQPPQRRAAQVPHYALAG